MYIFTEGNEKLQDKCSIQTGDLQFHGKGTDEISAYFEWKITTQLDHDSEITFFLHSPKLKRASFTRVNFGFE
jgi:hypothetical protein